MTRTGPRRLGLVGAGSALALMTAVLSPFSASADPVPSASSGILVTKTWAGPAGPVADGTTRSAELKAENPGPLLVENVYVIDYFDHGLTPSATPGCVIDDPLPSGMGRLYCGPVDLASGDDETWNVTFTANYVGPRKYTHSEKVGERIDVQKAETNVTIQKGVTDTFSVKCPLGYKMVDMSFVKQHVDQDTGTLDDIHVVTSDLFAADEWRVTLHNASQGQAQGKIWAVCVMTLTNQGSTVLIDPAPQVNRVLHPLAPGVSRTIYAHCAAGRTPVAVDLRAIADNAPPHAGGSAYSDVLIHKTGMEADGGRRVRVWVTVNQPADVTLEWQCMSTGNFTDGKRMQFDVVSGSKLVAHGATGQVKLTCDHGYKGIIGGWMGGKINGTEPQPVSRIFWFYNTTGSAKTYDVHLLCMRTRLVKGGSIDHTYKKPLVNLLTAVTTNDAGTEHWWANLVRSDLEVFQ